MDGGTAQNGGDLGVRTLTQLPDALGDAIFAMDQGEIDGPVKSDFGFHIVQLDEILAQGPRPLDEVRGELLAEMRSNEADGLFIELERKVSDALFDAKSMQEIAESAGLGVQSASGFSRTGGEPFGSNQVAIDTVFEDSVLLGGRISDIVELDANRSAVFRVVNYQQAMRQPLEDVREQVVEAVKADAANRIMIDKAEQMLQAIAEGAEFAAAAEAVGAAASEAQLVARNAQTVDQSVAFAVFTAGKPEQGKPLVGRTQNTTGGHTVYSVEAVLAGRPESIPVAERDAGRLQLAQESGMADYIAFVTNLRESAEVIVNEDIVAAQDLL
jgi:peptidyl-prolyl cis-trans isomerase D